nr:opacity protein P.IIf - Neisseria gonorrhoeae (strain FA1090) (fragments) [Neisseria gonorrhoeae]
RVKENNGSGKKLTQDLHSIDSTKKTTDVITAPPTTSDGAPTTYNANPQTQNPY